MPHGVGFFDHITCLRITPGVECWDAMQARLRHVGLLHRTVPVARDPRYVDRRVAETASHRSALCLALAAGAERALVLEDGAMLHRDAGRLLGPLAAALARREWELIFLGAATWGEATEPADQCPQLHRGRFTGCCAVGYTRPAMERIVATMPADSTGLADWSANHRSFDAFLQTQPDRLLAEPRLASLPEWLPYEDPASRDGFLP